MPTNTVFYVYILRDPRPGKNLQPIYVGKGTGKRSHAHWLSGDKHYNSLLRRVLAKIRLMNLKPIVDIVCRFEIEADAFICEIKLIAQYGRRDKGTGVLCNLTDGGEGLSGYVPPPEHRAKISATKRGKPRAITAATKEAARLHGDSMRGKKRVVTIAMREAARRNGDKLRGRIVPPETGAKISAAHTGRKASPETLAKRIGRKPSPETCAKIKESLLRHFAIKQVPTQHST